MNDSAESIDIAGEAFARRLANLLTHRRTTTKRSVRAMARRSDGHFTARQLRRFESSAVTLDPVITSALASLYEVDLDHILPLRSEIAITGDGLITAGGVDAVFEPGDPGSLLETYLRLVRRLRDQERDEVVSLRREDIEGLAEFLGQSGESVIEQLGTLMGATKTQRRVMAGMFLTGAMIITVAVPSVAALSTGSGTDTGATVTPPSAAVADIPAAPDASDVDHQDRDRTTVDHGAGVDGMDDGTGDADGPRLSSPLVIPAGPVTVGGAPSLSDDDPGTPEAPAVEPAPSQPAPIQPAPSEPAPIQSAPIEPAEPAVEVGTPPTPTEPSLVVDPVVAPSIPAPAPSVIAPDALPEPEPEPEPDDVVVAVGPPPVPAPPSVIVDPIDTGPVTP